LLLAVDEVVVTIAHAPSLQRRQIGSCFGLREDLPGDCVTLQDLREIALFLLIGAMDEDSRRTDDTAQVAKRRPIVPR
jgi:hypothetical protein